MNLVLTGGSGFLGRSLKSQIEHFNRKYISREINLIDARLIGNRSDYLDLDWKFESLPSESDSIVHLAWEGIPDYENDIHLAQVEKHVLWIKKMLEVGFKNFYIAGTCFEYGNQQGELYEELPSMPMNNYSLGKIRFFQSLLDLKSQYDFKLTWFRIFYVFGIGQHKNSLFASFNNAVASQQDNFRIMHPNLKRDFLPVNQAAEKIIKILELGEENIILNICSGKPTSVLEMVALWNQPRQIQIDLKNANFETNVSWGSIKKYNEATE